LPFYIAYLKKKAIGQFIREEGPKSHAAKAHTPTAGGVVFALATLVVSFVWLHVAHGLNEVVLSVLAASLVCAALGFVDDLAKVLKKQNSGVSGWLRLSIEIVTGIILAAFLFYRAHGGDFFLAFSHSPSGPPAWGFFVPFLPFVLFGGFLLAATSNAINLHDGMDGLAAGTSAFTLAALCLMLFTLGRWQLACVASTLAGALAAFCCFNCYPAAIFMGDTGSLFIGGLMASIVLAGHLEIWFIPLAAIYIVETLSVIAQVLYFKLTKDYKPEKPVSNLKIILTKLTKRLPGNGKRLLRMAPLHHHFESLASDKGIAEWQVVLGFWGGQLILVALVLCVFYLL
jgi:phospho-N-acetylmuramoyl-pentapeptide-transferase